MSEFMVTPWAELQAMGKEAAAREAIFRQLEVLRHVTALSDLDMELYLAVVKMVNQAERMINLDLGSLQGAYSLVDGVEWVAIHEGEKKLERAAHATCKMILWTIGYEWEVRRREHERVHGCDVAHAARHARRAC